MLAPAPPAPPSGGIIAAARDGMNLAEAAAAAGVHRTTISRWVSGGVDGLKLRSVKVGGRRRVTRGDLEAFLTALTRGAAA